MILRSEMKVKVSMRYVVKITESRTVIPKSNGEGGWKLLFNGSRRVVGDGRGGDGGLTYQRNVYLNTVPTANLCVFHYSF